jgi:Uma2 family endonuclease
MMVEAAMPRTVPYSPSTPDTVVCSDGQKRAVPEHMALGEFEAFPWPEGQRWELLWGTPIMTAAPKDLHQELVGELYTFLRSQLKGASLHPKIGIDVQPPGTENYVCPDIVVVEKNKVAYNEQRYEAAPVIAIEVLSKSTAGIDFGAKLEAYEEAGIAEYWIADPTTCALTLHVQRGPEGYEITPTDASGFVKSPTLKLSLKIKKTRDGYRIQTKN